MTLQEQASDEAATGGAESAGNERRDHYTGVVIIHGIGDTKRNTTLQEAIDTLSYWFTQKAGLALRPEGPGRFWLTAALTDDPNPDAPAARATMELEAPPAPAATPGEAQPTGAPPLRLEWREVWWAEAFGLPSVGATIRWARIQAREQAKHLLIPLGRQVGPAKTATRAPARKIPQALTYRPIEDRGPAPSARASFDTGQRRTLQQAALWLYDRLQYVWKALQWLVLTPLVLLLLLVLGVVRLLALIPFLRSSVIATISAVIDRIMLHWVASMQVYTLEYTRASVIRQRFEREVNGFLCDKHCDRIVVIAHSLGTVIAYEGLTTALAQPDVQDSQKPITFLCLAQAFRRIWLASAADPHRVRSVLPDRVRWLHFWARYDPVATGPLSARSLPPIATWPDAVEPNPYEALRARLDGCENIDVVNTDSIFLDHLTYWENLEQVVGPIARELVAGHPALEQVVQAHLATPDDVLERRARVAWPASVALLGAIAAGVWLFVWDSQQHWAVGHGIVGFLGSTAFGNLLSWVVGLICPDCSTATSAVSQIPLPPGLRSYLVPVSIPGTVADVLATVAASLALMGIAAPVISRLVATPAPSRHAPEADDAAAHIVLRLSVASFALPGVIVAAALLLSILTPQQTSVLDGIFGSVFSLSLLLLGPVAWAWGLIHAAGRRRWGWFAAMLPTSLFAFLALVLFLIFFYVVSPAQSSGGSIPEPARRYYNLLSALFFFLGDHIYADIPLDILLVGGPVAIVGLMLGLYDAARRRRWGWLVALVVALVVVLFTLLAGLGTQLVGVLAIDAFPVVFAAYTTTLVYAQWASRAALKAQGESGSGPGSIVVLAFISLLLLLRDHSLTCRTFVTFSGYSQCYSTVFVLAAVGGVVAIAAGTLVVIDIIRRRRWIWLPALALIAVLMLSAWGFREKYILENNMQLQPLYPLLSGLWAALLTAILSYGLWSGTPTTSRKTE